MPMRILVVDDEPLARSRLRDLLAECRPVGGTVGDFVVAEATQAVQAMALLQHQPWDVLLLDIHMPGVDGLALAQHVQALTQPPAVVFVTAHAEHAVRAFELDALDYLTKPVRLERLQQALDKVARWQARPARPVVTDADFLLIHDRGRTERVPLDDIVYLKAELKYLTVRTSTRSLIYDGSLLDMEQAHPGRWLRVHRNALVARHRIRALESGHPRSTAAQDGEHHADGHDGWCLQLDGVDERVAVSRRQLAVVREALAGGAC